MTNGEWTAKLIKVAAGEIRRHRDRSGLSAQQVADACSDDYGLSMKRSVIANLESGRRPTLSLMELLVLARVLRVAPVQLVIPIGHEEEIEVLPGTVVRTWDALKWFTGDAPLIRRDGQGAELPLDPRDLAAWNSGSSPIPLFREHDRLLQARQAALTTAASARKAGRDAADDFKEMQILRAETEERRVREIERQIREGRAYMRQQGLLPPALPADLSHLDDEATP
ncbi:helix-turn-helix domain-containing protein [Actinomadura rudentiformis]|uniref:helix-turn-helix domain-containing protein n=1 Tax=Actinomadura rudentiformis TaxID=359158 RepID=UPI00178C4DB7|nr:helix-turn-helix transcriptional regulator [Actinomadura rudentiformis]